MSSYFYNFNDCTCNYCEFCTFNIIKNVQTVKKSLIERINEDFPSDTTPFSGETRCSTPIGQKKEPENMLQNDILQFVTANKSFIFKNVDVLITPDSLTEEIILLLCKDQDASRFIQKRLDLSTEMELDWLFNIISNHLIELSCDLFGNYVIQKYVCTHGEIIYDILRNRLFLLSYDIYGCRVVQKLLDMIYFNLEDEFVNSVVDLTKDQNGNHVIQKVIEVGKLSTNTQYNLHSLQEYKGLEKEQDDCYRIQFLLRDFENKILEMCKHKYGCRAVQRLFEFCYNECKLMIDKILENLDDLIYDQFGNYVIQHLLNCEAERSFILEYLCSNIMKLSCHKFASNVVEKGITVAKDQIYMIGDILMEKSNIIALASSGFGNYVLQRMVESKDVRIREACKLYYNDLRKCVYGKQVLSKVFSM